MRPETVSIIENLVRLSRVANRADGPIAAEVLAIEEDLERLVGPTVRPADAARLLGVSDPAVKRWLDRGEIASVMSPQGRREIPLGDLVELLRDVEDARAAGAARPLTRVIRERRRAAAETVDIDQLLPRRRLRTHRTAELQALAFHRLVAQRLDDRLVDQARRRVESWKRSRRVHPRWISEWERVLSRSTEEIAQAISADTPAASELRQTSPFAGALTEQERRLLSSAVAARGAG